MPLRIGVENEIFLFSIKPRYRIEDPIYFQNLLVRKYNRGHLPTDLKIIAEDSFGGGTVSEQDRANMGRYFKITDDMSLGEGDEDVRDGIAKRGK